MFGKDFSNYDAACDDSGVIEQQKSNNKDAIKVQCLLQYNRDFDDFENELMIGVMALRIFNLIYCILCYKFRHLSNNILYLECLFRMVAATIPRYVNEDKADYNWG